MWDRADPKYENKGVFPGLSLVPTVNAVRSIGSLVEVELRDPKISHAIRHTSAPDPVRTLSRFRSDFSQLGSKPRTVGAMTGPSLGSVKFS